MISLYNCVSSQVKLHPRSVDCFQSGFNTSAPVVPGDLLASILNALIIVLQVLVVLLAGCTEFEAKIEEMNVITQPTLDEQMHENDGLQQ